MGQNKGPKQVKEEDLDRFAGSSEEEKEEEEEDENESGSENELETSNSSPKREFVHQHDHSVDAEDEASSESSGNESSDDDGNHGEDEKLRVDDDVVDSEEEEEEHQHSGMAAAMSRILSGATKSSQPVVLSKTKTPLQKQLEQERQKEKELREKRRFNRERDLTALHIPLTVATTAAVHSSKDSIQKELEAERQFRRVATRGVVALFNAITQHQKRDTEAKVEPDKTKKGEVNKLSKSGFLDLIRTKAKEKQSASKPEELPKWNALQDDYMLDAKKDWGQDESSDEGGNLESLSDNESDEDDGRPAKKQRAVKAQ